MTRKSVKSGSVGGGWKSRSCCSLAAYPTNPEIEKLYLWEIVQ
jgi:hypothetical protein